MILPTIETPSDLRSLSPAELDTLAAEIRAFIVESVTTTGGHLGSNLGVVELALALPTPSCGTPATRPTSTSCSPAAATASGT
jgi:transketolase N-terminal domain/subunit